MPDIPLENEYLREQLNRVRRWCAKHREMGQNAESELRSLKRTLEAAKYNFGIYQQHYQNVADTEISEAALKNLAALLSSK